MNAVVQYFHGPNTTAAQRQRLLVVNFTAPDAGRTLCEFLMGGMALECERFTNLPNVSPSNMTFWQTHPTSFEYLNAANAVVSLAYDGDIVIDAFCTQHV